MDFLGINVINNLVINMVCLLFATILFGIGCKTFSSAEADYLHKASDEIDSDQDGEKFIKDLVNGKSKCTNLRYNFIAVI